MQSKHAVCIASVSAFFISIFASQASALSDGYILCGAYAGKNTVLLDRDGHLVFNWQHDSLIDTLNGYSCYLLENGDLLRTAQVPSSVKCPANAMPQQGAINRIDPFGKLVWRYVLADDSLMLHHDMKPMSNGNIIACSFVAKTKPQLIAAGVDTTVLGRGRMATKFMLAEKIIEIKPKAPEGGDIVWEWNILDHIVHADSQASQHPELFSGSIVPNLFAGQWVHLNGIDYNARTDEIVFSSRIFSECYVIDHGTTTQQAAGHTGGPRGKGGDLLYRWGKAANYGMTDDYTLECLHSTTWIPEGYPGAGHICFFHNSSMAVAKSEVIEITPPSDGNGNFQHTAGQAFGPSQPTWKFCPEEAFYSPYMSSAMRMPNGNTIVHEAYPQSGGMMMMGETDSTTNSMIWEVTQTNQVVWKYRMQIKSGLAGGIAEGFSMAYNPAKIMYYPSNYIGIAKLFERGGRIKARNEYKPASALQPCINPAVNRVDFSNVAGCDIGLYTLQGKCVFSCHQQTADYSFETKRLPVGLYCAKVISSGRLVGRRITAVIQ